MQRYNYLFVGFAIFAFLGVVAVLVGFVTHYFTLSAENSRVQYGDLSRFERVVQRLGPSEASWARTFDDEYLAFPYNGLQIERRSSGLSGAQLAGMIAADPLGWSSCRFTEQLKELEPTIREGLTRFEVLYPRAIFPGVYFTLGSGQRGVMSGFEGIAVDAAYFRSDLDDCGGNVNPVRRVDELPCLIVRDMVRFNQTLISPIASRRLAGLGRAIQEGSADFVTELALGCRADIDIGYRIVSAHYEGSSDKEEAIRRIMNISDYQQFLEESGYL